MGQDLFAKQRVASDTNPVWEAINHSENVGDSHGVVALLPRAATDAFLAEDLPPPLGCRAVPGTGR